ncbi:flavoprotein [Haloactinospora alba]|nr:flavoprotein [Haloactinospora alba]
MHNPTLHLVLSGATTAGESAADLVRMLSGDGWSVTAFSTPMGERFHDLAEIAEITGTEAATEFRTPGTGQRVQPADRVVACPLSFNSTNKLAAGFADTMALALLCEMIGLEVPTVVVPKGNTALYNHPAFPRSLAVLRSVPATTVLHDPDRGVPSWREVVRAARTAPT